MRKRFGFSLIELVLSLGLFSLLLTVFLKLNAWEQARTQVVLEEQNLMAYAETLKWTLSRENGMKDGIWSGFQDSQTRDRKFVRGVKKESVCIAEVTKEECVYYIVLRKKGLRINLICVLISTMVSYG